MAYKNLINHKLFLTICIISIVGLLYLDFQYNLPTGLMLVSVLVLFSCMVVSATNIKKRKGKNLGESLKLDMSIALGCFSFSMVGLYLGVTQNTNLLLKIVNYFLAFLFGAGGITVLMLIKKDAKVILSSDDERRLVRGLRIVRIVGALILWIIFMGYFIFFRK